MYKILFIGPQGSGKGTQAQLLAEKFGLPIFSTGNILRQKVQQQDELGREIKSLIDAGYLVPDELVNKIIAEKIKTDGQKGYILDGYPRNLAQAEFLANQDELTHVIEIDLPEEETIRRVGGRRTCPECQRVYHIEHNPPEVEGLCDDDDESLVIREDETEEALKKRLAIYHEQTEPVIEFYKAKNIHHKIDGRPAIERVFEEVMSKLATSNS
ncbi:nucleoside monophosphate kinase [Candidatus Kuenenbacteria bacterium]|nr:nucleoside monophosphate kinase [Candidatus Kuenenbacteria bacterium]